MRIVLKTNCDICMHYSVCKDLNCCRIFEERLSALDHSKRVKPVIDISCLNFKRKEEA